MSHRFSGLPSARRLALAAGLLVLAGCAGGEASKYAGNWSRDLTGEGEVKMNLASNGGIDRKSTRLNSSHIQKSRMPSSA